MGGKDVLDALNAKEMQMNRDDPHPELRGMLFKWDSCKFSGVKNHLGKLKHMGTNQKQYGKYATGKYKLKYHGGYEYIPRPWYNSNKKKAKGRRVSSVTIPHTPVEIVAPSIVKLAGQPIKPYKGTMWSNTYKVWYYGGKYRIGEEISNQSVDVPKYANLGEDTSKKNILYDALQGLSKANVTPNMPKRRPWGDGTYPLEKMYPKYIEYESWFIDTIVDDFVVEMLSNAWIGRGKRGKRGNNSISEELRNEDDMPMLEHSYSPIMKQEK